MPVGGLSLLGFMDQALAQHYLSNYCIVSDPSAPAVLQHWNDARARLGSPHPHPGQPSIQNIPAAHNAHLQQFSAHTRLQPPVPIAWDLKLVEIAPLVAFQFHVATERSAERFRALPRPPQINDMLPICLPLHLETCQPTVIRTANSVLLRETNLNFQMLDQGGLGEDAPKRVAFEGIAVGPSNPWVTVTRFNGRCYLSNGYHRAYELQAAGASHMPCMFLDVANYEGIGARGGGGTFERALLESANPPTCGHFTDARAYRVILRRLTRLIEVHWAQHTLSED